MAADLEWWHHLMTSAWILRHVEGAWWRVQMRGGETDTQTACVGACNVVWPPNSQAKYIGGRQGRLGGACDWDLSWESRICGGACEISRSRCLRVMQRAAVVGGRVRGFWSRYAVEQVCLVGFIRWRLVVHRFNRESHELLGLEDLDTATSHGGYEMLCSLNPADKHVWLLMAVCLWESSLFARDVCLMPKTKFGSDTMLNILLLATQCVIPCCVC